MSNEELHAQMHQDLQERLGRIETAFASVRSDVSKMQGHAYAASAICGLLVSVAGYILK